MYSEGWWEVYFVVFVGIDGIACRGEVSIEYAFGRGYEIETGDGC